MPGWPEHLLAAAVLLVTPLVAWRSARAGVLRQPAQIDRLMTYALNGAVLAVAGIVVPTLWLVRGRPLGELRFGAPAWGPWGELVAVGSLLLAEALVLALWLHHRLPEWQARTAGAARDLVHGGLRGLLPRSGGELVGFAALSGVAALAEELLFRAFLVWWFEALVPTGAAVALAAIPFAVGHAYQGWQGPAKALVAGVALGGLMVALDSVWPAVVLHAALNVATAALLLPHLRREGLALHGPEREG